MPSRPAAHFFLPSRRNFLSGVDPESKFEGGRKEGRIERWMYDPPLLLLIPSLSTTRRLIAIVVQST